MVYDGGGESEKQGYGKSAVTLITVILTKILRFGQFFVGK